MAMKGAAMVVAMPSPGCRGHQFSSRRGKSVPIPTSLGADMRAPIDEDQATPTISPL
jgi:hypothetical protein